MSNFSSNSRIKIAVLGAGAVGSLIGGLLQKSGEDVTLIARPEHARAINNKGLQIDGALGVFSVPVRAAETLDFSPDLVLLTVKTQDIEATCRPIIPLLKNATIVTLQNGLKCEHIIASLLPEASVISGVVMFNANFLTPGHVNYTLGGSLIIGEAFGDNGPRTKDVQVLLNMAIPTEISNNIIGVRWTKLLINNLGNGLEGMTGLPIGKCMEHAGLRKIGIMEFREGYFVAKKAGVQLGGLPKVPASTAHFIANAPLFLASLILKLRMGSLKTTSSTLQSLQRGRPTEINFLNGEIVSIGEKLSIATPFNKGIVTTVKEVERSGRFFTPEELVDRLL